VAEQLKLPEVARRLGVSEKTARRYVKSGALPSMFVGGAYRVSEEDLEGFLQDAKVTPSGGSPKAPASSQPSFNRLLEEERRATISDVLGSWRGMHEEGVARWSRATERGFSSADAAAAFCAEVIAEGAVGQTIITRHLVPQTEVLLPEDDAARERKELLETHAHLGEAMSAVIDVVEGMVDSEKDADAASKAIGRYLDQAVSRAIDETREERHDRPDLELWLRRERRRRRQAGAQATAESGEGSRKRPTA
jgi:excisionase family DNA binding protein